MRTLQPLFEPTTLQIDSPQARLFLTFPVTEADDADMLRCMTAVAATKYLPMVNPNMTLEEMVARRESQAASGVYKVFKINTLRTGAFIGYCGFYRMDIGNFAYDCGLSILEEFHRSGYATEALFLVLDHGFMQLGFNRTTFVTNSKNVGMRGWLENVCGARLEGTFREAWRDEKVDGWVDCVMYSILRSEWEGGMRDRLLTKVNKYLVAN
ncbi:hypothetical protein HDU79_002187 [Rhizoclosmatium sp. JEL0117]|nr:hypothetical protein HDU79_002187 [Rhizoclosmatium sp. JEL0117]